MNYLSNIKKKKNVSTDNTSQVKIGSYVRLKSILDGKILEFKLISSHTEVHYKTMGYKTKNYAEVYKTSDADGSSTISDLSPLGKAILNKHSGDIIEYNVNGNIKRYSIISVL